ncbi:MAG: [FeFe] hydrogenase H-cluster maturation GTPase HydF [Clostridiales bacterium]|nr:[FeFe] hydrogenase H-cluster maturation GTPase HydF [Clostridiales bacterium]
MHKTPRGSRKYVTILGNVNVGKSTLFNAILGQERSIVSDHKGTTTDPVAVSMELIPFGPIVLVDTGGLDDFSPLGEQRIRETRKIVNRTDLILYVIDINSFDEREFTDNVLEFTKKNIPHILVFTKCDKATKETIAALQSRYTEAAFISNNEESIELLKAKIGQCLGKLDKDEETLIGDILPKGSIVVMVVSIDAGAPKGRLILPQVQFIRDCLDHGVKCLVTKEDELESALVSLQKVDLVVTDSQNFKTVERVVPQKIPLTSFSMLLARQKGDMDMYMEGIKAIADLTEGAKILIAETCTHNTSHEDIGRVKIPTLLKEHIGKELKFDFYSGHDFPDKLRDYALVIHCGGCMMNKKGIKTRLEMCQDMGVPVTNYGVILAHLSGILKRCSELFYG